MRIAYVILTCESYWNTRVVWQRETCLLTVPQEDIYYLGHIHDPAQRIYHWTAKDDHESQSQKIIDFFINMTLDSYDYIIICDDDTYVFHDRMQRFVATYDPTTMTSIGNVHNPETFDFFYSGAGIVLTSALYKELYSYVRLHPEAVHPYADVCIGRWINSLSDVYAVHHEQFHSDYYNSNTDQIASAITFHHVKKEEQYRELHMRIGVAIPCFVKHISQCLRLLDALEHQTRRPDEVVVSCSSTTDFPVVSYSYPIRILITDKKQNASTNRNCAAKQLQTDIICFFDADDEMHPQRLELIAKSMYQTDILLHSFFQDGERLESYPVIDPSNYTIMHNVLRQAPSGCIMLDGIQRIHHGQVSVTKEVYQQVQFPEEPEYEVREDCVFCFRVFSLPGIRSVYLPYPLSKYSPSWTCVTEKIQ